MRITTKGRYALRAVLALAKMSIGGAPVSIKSIAEQEEISPEFLEQIFFKLRKAGVIGSVRGPGGGFYFSKALSEITLLDVIDASGEGFSVMPCACGKKTDCQRGDSCEAGRVWRDLDSHLRIFVEGRTLADMVQTEKAR